MGGRLNRLFFRKHTRIKQNEERQASESRESERQKLRETEIKTDRN